jgi:hypothetical protein
LIGQAAFSGCNGITGELRIPQSVTDIDNLAFANCTKITEVLLYSATVKKDDSFPPGVIFTFLDPLQFTFSDDSKTEITGIEGGSPSSRRLFPEIPSTVTSISQDSFNNYSNLVGPLSIPSSVTSIGSNAFDGCSGLTGTLTIPSSVTSIGSRVFMNCSGFTSLSLAEGLATLGINSMFQSCTGFKGALTIPQSIKTIPSTTFNGCTGFSGSLDIRSTVKTIGDSAFVDCNGITSVSYYEGTTLEGSQQFPSGATVTIIIPLRFTFEDDSKTTITGLEGGYPSEQKPFPEIPLTVTSIGVGAFAGYSELVGPLSIPLSVTSIGFNAFSNCSGFNGNLIIPSSVTSIGGYAFTGCLGFTSLTLEEGLLSIGEFAFASCTGLTGALTIPSSVTSIGNGAFSLCSSITSVSYYEGTTLDGGNHFPVGVPVTILQRPLRFTFEDDSKTTITGVEGGNPLTQKLFPEIPSTVTSIAAGAFSEHSNLIGSLTIPPTVTTIGNNAFNGCSGFTGELNIPTNLTSIAEATFKACTAFTVLTIPESVTNIENSAFEGCIGFTGQLTIPLNLITIGDRAFYGCTSFTGDLVIPANVYRVGDNAFRESNGITTVTHYDGLPLGIDPFPAGAVITVISSTTTQPPPATFLVIPSDFCTSMGSIAIDAGVVYNITNNEMSIDFYINGNPYNIPSGDSIMTFLESGNLSCN